jgi:ribosomal-protein-alanine N-acetyltransferase
MDQGIKHGEGWDRVAIKRMEVEDVEEVAPIAAAAAYNPWSKKMILEEIAHPFSHCFLLQQRAEAGAILPLGFLCFRQIGEEAELLNLCVDPEFRQQGFGKKLMSFYIEFCEGRGVNQYFLEVNTLNTPAIHLYHSFGFQSIGTRKNFYQGKQDALLMTRCVF